MNILALSNIASGLLAGDKGLLAMDESNGTCDLRLAAAGIPPSAEVRRRYREMILSTPGLGECISGVILYDETIRQARHDGKPFVAIVENEGIILGVKVDTGAKDLAGRVGEKITEGLDGLRDRLRGYFDMGARFAKWRAVFGLGKGLPSRGCVDANAHALARYAALCQSEGLVPIVEPEVLMEGDHGLAACQAATEMVLRAVFDQLTIQEVNLGAMILKPNMILPGLHSAEQPTSADVARATLATLRRVVPAEVPGVAFLSGGQSGELASARLNAMNATFRSPSVEAPWALTFSFARAIQQPSLAIWAGEDANRAKAQRALLHRAKCNWAARQGRYNSAIEAKSA